MRASSLRRRIEGGGAWGRDSRGVDLMRTGDTASYLLHDFLFCFFFFASLLQLLTASCFFCLLLLRVCIFSSVFLCGVCVEIIIYNFI